MEKFKLATKILMYSIFVQLLFTFVIGCTRGGNASTSPNNAPDQAKIDSIKRVKAATKGGVPNNNPNKNEHR
jgi:hypothetical protein